MTTSGSKKAGGRRKRLVRAAPPRHASGEKSALQKSAAPKIAGQQVADQPMAAASPSPRPFPVIGIGASAGGLEAYEQFFRSVPPDSGMAFVLVPHLDPGHASILTEILQRSTVMPVVEAQDQMAVARDHVYVIPPNRDMAIFSGTLQLSLPEVPRGQRMPIDAFLRSLALDQGERAIGIILSGTGTDGTLGLRAIHGAGGITLAQEPATAKYDGMPASAVRSGFASHVLPVEKMAAVLQAGSSSVGKSLTPAEPTAPVPLPAGGMNRLLMLLRIATGHDFSLYKKSTIRRRIERRMSQHDLTDIDVYCRFLKEHPAEAKALFKELLINVTSFFRDPEAFDALKQELPRLFADKLDGYVVRVWVAGCATGEEAYSIAMLLREYMNEVQREFKVQIYSTDLDDDAIAFARAGVYPPNIAADVTPERLRRFFAREEADYRVKKEVREMVVFAIQNVIKDPPFTRLDLVSCRNLMIYLEADLQSRLIPILHYALRPDGLLFLSPSESIGSRPELFAPANRKCKIYRAIHTASSARTLAAGDSFWAADSGGKGANEAVKKTRDTNFAELTRRVLLQSYAPASVVTDAKGKIVFVHGETGKYLRPAPGQATLNAMDMARDDLQLELRAALTAAATRGTSTLGREVALRTEGKSQTVLLSVRPLPDSDAGERLVLVSFQDAAEAPPLRPVKAAKSKKTPPPARGKRSAGSSERRQIEALAHELANTRESLQATVEEQQASNEELKSTNEELQSTNEELQSTNEELETSKEELQSINEELVTVNAELQAKIEQLSDMQNDMKNLLDNISVGTVFLDEHLVIRRFTREAAHVFRLVASDIGRPLTDIKSDVEGNDLLVEVRTVLETLVASEREVRTVSGAWYLARIQPYRTLENMIDGVVLTFSNISRRVAAEESVQAARRMAEGIIDTVREPLLVLDSEMKVVSASRAFYRQFQVAPEETLGRRMYDLGNHQWDIPALRELLGSILQRNQTFEDFTVEHDFPQIGRRRMSLNARRVIDGEGELPLILLAIGDVGEQNLSQDIASSPDAMVK